MRCCYKRIWILSVSVSFGSFVQDPHSSCPQSLGPLFIPISFRQLFVSHVNNITFTIVWQLQYCSIFQIFQLTFVKGYHSTDFLICVQFTAKYSDPLQNQHGHHHHFGRQWWHPVKVCPSSRPLWLCANWLLDIPFISFPFDRLLDSQPFT